MKNEKKKNSFWSPRSGVFLAMGFLGLGGIPYLIQGTKAFAETGKISPAEVVKTTKEEHEKKAKDHESAEKLREIKAAAMLADGTVYAGGKGGLAVRKDGKWSKADGFPGDEAKAIAAGPDGSLWVAGKKGLHLLKNGSWKIEKEGDMHSVSVAADGTVLAVGKKGLLSRSPSGDWIELAASLPEELANPKN